MSLAKESWSSTLFGIMASKGFTGSDLKKFTDAVGEGSVNHLKGKPFTTTDSGGDGSAGGHGIGLTDVSVGLVSSTIYSTSTSLFGSSGSDLMKVCESVEEAMVLELLNAEMDGLHSKGSGVGIIDVGSIPVVGEEWGSMVETAGRLQSFIGSDWPNLAKAIGVGCAAGFVTVTGKLIIGAGGGANAIS